MPESLGCFFIQQQPVNNPAAMPNKANVNPTWELVSTSIAQALPSNIQKTCSQAQLPSNKPKKQPKPKMQPKTQSKN